MQSTNDVFKLKDESTILVEETLNETLANDENKLYETKSNYLKYRMLDTNLLYQACFNSEDLNETAETAELKNFKSDSKNLPQIEESSFLGASFSSKSQDTICFNQNGEVNFDSLILDNIQLPRKIDEALDPK